jgi:tetratricopeptide (TPR) repeat protein
MFIGIHSYNLIWPICFLFQNSLMNRHKQRKKNRPQREPKPAQTGFAKLLLVAGVGAAAIIGLWIALVPLKEPLVERENLPREPIAQNEFPLNTSPTPTQAVTQYVLPTERDALPTEQLQVELEHIATRLSEIATDPTALHVAAVIEAELKHTQRARELWETCLKLGRLEVGPVLGLADLLLQAGDDQTALEWLERLKRSAAQLPVEYFVKLAEVYSQMGELELAETTAQKGLEQFPSFPPLLAQQGLIKTQLQKLDEAESLLKKAIGLGDRSSATSNALVALLNRVGKSEEAKSFAVDSAAPTIASTSAVEAPADDRVFQENYRFALRSLSVPLIRKATAVALTHSKSDWAEKWSRIAVAEEPNNPALYMDLAAALRKGNKLQEALSVHQRLVEVQPDNPYNDLNLASLAHQLNQPAFAEEVLLKAISKSPGVAYLQGQLAKLLLMQGDLKRMEQYASKAAEIEPNNIDWTILLVIAAKESNRTADMQRHLQRARQISPNDPRLLDFSAASP